MSSIDCEYIRALTILSRKHSARIVHNRHVLNALVAYASSKHHRLSSPLSQANCNLVLAHDAEVVRPPT